MCVTDTLFSTLFVVQSVSDPSLGGQCGEKEVILLEITLFIWGRISVVDLVSVSENRARELFLPASGLLLVSAVRHQSHCDYAGFHTCFSLTSRGWCHIEKYSLLM